MRWLLVANHPWMTSPLGILSRQSVFLLPHPRRDSAPERDRHRHHEAAVAESHTGGCVLDRQTRQGRLLPRAAPRSEERREGKSVDLGGRRNIQKKSRTTEC